MSDAATGLTTSAAHDAVAGTSPSSPTSRGTPLADFPADATFRVWRKPPTGAEAQDGGSLHVSELILGDGDHVLVFFDSMLPSKWEEIRHHLNRGADLDLKPLLAGSVDRAHIASGLWGAKESAGLHGLTNTPTHPMVFVPSPTLMRLLKIERGSRTRNALFLIRNGHICAEWISGGDGDRPHDWTTISSMVN